MPRIGAVEALVAEREVGNDVALDHRFKQRPLPQGRGVRSARPQHPGSDLLQREVDTNRSLYDALLQRYKEIGVAGGIGTAPVSIVDRAKVPGGPHKPNLLLNLVMGLGLGLLAGLATAVALEYLYDTIKTRDDVRHKLGLACLGAIPKTTGQESFIEELKDPRSIVSEAYSAVVASLRFSTEEGLPKTLVVTSTRSGEGKSSSALAVAQNFARRGASVLLIDSDLRKPAFKAASDKLGLTRLLTGDEEAARSHIVPDSIFRSLADA